MGPRQRRIYVDDSQRGIPFLAPSEMTRPDLSGVKFVSRKYTPGWEYLLLKRCWTLVSRSGAIGNLVYVRSDMENMAGSDDIIRIVADESKVKPGYLFSFLSSPIGQSLIQQNTYGAVIQHIEPQHLHNLPVPLLSHPIQRRIHNLIERAAALRVEATQTLKASVARMENQILGLPKDHRWNYKSEHAYAIEIASFTSQTTRLDAFYHAGYTQEGVRLLKNSVRLSELAKAYQPPIFKRPYTDKENGIAFLSGIDLYDVVPQPHMYISKKMQGLNNYVVEAGTLLVQNVGQRYGLFGRPTILPEHLDGAAVTQHLMRLYPHDPRDRGFIYIYLLSEVGRRALLRQSFGTSMGVLLEHSFEQTETPECKPLVRHSFEDDVTNAISLRKEAYDLETKSQSLLLSELSL